MDYKGDYAEFAAQEVKTHCQPLKRYDWDKRARARVWGLFIPMLCGDMDLQAQPYLNVVDDFGNWIGTNSYYA
jgi:hypothetical protein